MTQSAAQMDTPMKTGVSWRRHLACNLQLGFLILENARPKVNMKRERGRERESEREGERGREREREREREGERGREREREREGERGRESWRESERV